MVNCYIHTERQATNSCGICGRGICAECSNWVASDIYLCPKCWHAHAPVEPTPETRKTRVAAGGVVGAGLSRALYYATALILVVIGVWYVYATFIAPSIAPSGGTPPVVPTPSPFGEISSRYSTLITISVSMFIIVLIGGELMLRTGAKQPAVPTRPQVQPASQSVRDGPKKSPSTVTLPRVAVEKAGPRQSQPAAKQPEVQPITQALPAGPKPSQPPVTQPELQPLTPTLRTEAKPSQRVITQLGIEPPTQTRLVYCIYCGNKISSTALFCSKCGKGQK